MKSPAQILSVLGKFRGADGKRSPLFITMIVLLVLFFLGATSVVGVVVYLMQDLPDIGILEKGLAESTVILDKDGNEIYKLYNDENRTYVGLDKISKNMQHAIIAIEDRNFYSHSGVSFIGLGRAFVNNYIFRKQSQQGASTLTQQLVKNLVLKDSSKTALRKVKEAILAYQVESKYTKDKILELYLNQLSLGSTVHGVERGALTFFHKQAKDLSIAESAIIAAIPQAPSHFSPYGPYKKELLGYCKTNTPVAGGINVGDAGGSKKDEVPADKTKVEKDQKNKDAIVLTITALDKVWVKVTDAQNQKKFEGTIEKGDQVDVEGNSDLTFTSGNRNFEIYQDNLKLTLPKSNTFTLKKSEMASYVQNSTTAEDGVPESIQSGVGGCTSIDDPNYVEGRKDLVLRKMVEENYITVEEMKDAWKQSHQIVFKPYVEKITYPHFVMYVKEQLEKEYGGDVGTLGYVVKTTIDPKVQEMAENAIKKGGAIAASKYKTTNQALVAVEPSTGKIIAMVGSRDYWDEKNDGNVNITIRKRQPGSSFKPFVYALLFQGKYGPGSALWDVKTKFGGYSPNDYDGNTMGPMKVRNALAYSRNITAVKALILGGGEDGLLDFIAKFGFEYLKNNRDERNKDKADEDKYYYGNPIAIGTAEVRPLDMASGYGAFANEGNWVTTTSIEEIKDKNGNIVKQWNPEDKKVSVMDPQIAYEISDILSDSQARPAGFWRDALNVPGQIVAAKTGTSNKSFGKGKTILPSDLWTVGYSKYISVAVWSGNNDGSALPGNADGLNVSAPTWKEFMINFHAGKEKKPFEKPQGIVSMSVSRLSGLRASKTTPSEYISTDIFSSWAAPKDFDSAAKKIKVDSRNNLRANEDCPTDAVNEVFMYNVHSEKPEWKNWEEPVRAWAAGKGLGTVNDKPVSNEESSLCKKTKPENMPIISIVTPSNFGSVSGGKVNVRVQITAPSGVKKVEYFIDGKLEMQRESEPFTVGYVTVPADANSHSIKVHLVDKEYNGADSSVSVKTSSDAAGPVISIVSPAAGSKIALGSQLVMKVDAYDESSRINKLEVYMNGELIKVFSGEPYSYSIYVNPKYYQPGTYTISFKGSDTNGNMTQKTTSVQFVEAAPPTTPITTETP